MSVIRVRCPMSLYVSDVRVRVCVRVRCPLHQVLYSIPMSDVRVRVRARVRMPVIRVRVLVRCP